MLLPFVDLVGEDDEGGVIDDDDDANEEEKGLDGDVEVDVFVYRVT